MYIVIYSKETNRIMQIIPKKYVDDHKVTYGYSDNCAEVIVEEKPAGKFLEN